MSTPEIVTETDILVIGGGPSGSYAASALAREGYEVTLLERDHFPRYHIGESMLPSCRPFMRFIGVEQKVVDFGFCVKVGAALKFNQTKREGYTDFINPDPNKAAWNVSRAEFDDILLKHAGESGARVHEGVSVGAINFSPDNDKQPVSAEWRSDTGLAGEIKFKYLVDASGRNGIMSTKYLKNRKFNQALRSVAFWGYWTGANMYAPGTSRENATWLEALTDESGWCWFIPLAKGKVSVGIVLKEESSRAKKAQLSGDDINAQHYHSQLKLVPGVTRLLGDAKFLGEVMSAGDYSYSANQYAGPNYRIVGDAGGSLFLPTLMPPWIDPFFSSGVHLAFSSGLSAASSILAVKRGDSTEEEAIAFHNEKTGTSYTRFLLVVMSAYRQITSQSVPVLSDIDEDNFDRAFDFIRPVIQGHADTNDPSVTEDVLQATMDFCEHALGLTDPEMHEAVKSKLEPGLIDTLMADDGPILGPKDVMRIAGDDEETEAVLRRINSRKALEAVHWQPNFRGESFSGLAIRMERGSLGLDRAAAAA